MSVQETSGTAGPRFIDVRSPRASNDWYQDQPQATEVLLRAERFSGLSWDPACGVGTIPEAFNKASSHCMASDIVDRGYRAATQQDFLNPDDAPGSTGLVANIVSNPPFNLARQFVDKALSIATHKVAFLLPLTFLEGAARAQWLDTTPLARVHVFSWRISMPPGELLAAGKVRPTGGKKAFAWFVWEHGWRGRAPGVTPKSAGEDTNVRAKGSFHASTTAIVDTRYLRTYEPEVWHIATAAYPEAHFATFPPALVERCLLAGLPKDRRCVVLDPFGGAGTVGLVADRMGHDAILIDIHPDYAQQQQRRIRADGPMFADVQTSQERAA